MGTKHRTGLRSIYLVFALLLIANIVTIDAKRIYSGSSGRRTSSSSSSSSRRTNYSPSSHTSHSNTHTSNHDLTRLSYGNVHSQPSRTNVGSSSSINRHQPSAPAPVTSKPIGWAAPKPAGPPPAYSPVNPAGGARTNVHEPPPAYKPNAPAYTPAATRPQNTVNNANVNNRNTYTPASNYRPRMNSTGGFGGGGIHTPITATNAGHGVQSSYPRQQYYPAGSSLPAGATYHPAGHIPPGATYHPSGSIPQGATYYPGGSHIPAGATYHAPGHIPAGATYYPSGGVPHYPAAPPGATYLPVGSALPPGAVFYSQPPKSSSGLGFGSGLAAGALGGAILGHALTPSRTITQVQPSYNGAPQNNGDDRIIIINNGPPGSVTTTGAGQGTTVINTGAAQSAPVEQSVPLAQPIQPTQQQPIANAPQPPVAPPPAPVNPSAAGVAPAVAAAAQPALNPNAAAPPATNAAAPEQPPAGGIICVPVKVPQPDPNDNTKTIEVEQIACYPAPPPEASTVASVTSTVSGSNTTATTTTAATESTQTPSTTKDGIPLASFQQSTTPFAVPAGSVPLAPLSPSGQPDIMRMPGEPYVQHSSSVMLAPESNLHIASGAMSKHFQSLTFSSLLTLILAYCLH